MAGVSRHMARSFVQTARAAGRFCGTNGAAAAEAARCAAAPRSALPKSFGMRPGAFFGRLPGEVAMIQSLLPLHNATASARMVSQLRSSAGALLQDLAVEDSQGGPLYLRPGAEHKTHMETTSHLEKARIVGGLWIIDDA